VEDPPRDRNLQPEVAEIAEAHLDPESSTSVNSAWEARTNRTPVGNVCRNQGQRACRRKTAVGGPSESIRP
jgi:hypothetical protein